MRFSTLAAFAALPAAVCAQPADLVLRNGKIVTMNAAQPVAQALAVRGDRIAALGSDTDAARWIGPATKIIDLHGHLATPGLIEGHGHFTGIGEFRLGLDLREARTWDDIVAQVARAASHAKPGEWIIGRGWHQSKWDRPPDPNVEGFPLHASLDKVSPNNPVLLTHASGHAAFVNAKALEAAGVTRNTPNPTGGEILKDKAGNPTGLLRERAQGLAAAAHETWLAKRTPAERAAEQRKVIDLATAECLSNGITTFEDAGSSFSTIDAFRRLVDSHELRLRLWVMVSGSQPNLEANLDKYRTIGAGDNHLTVRAIKQYMDGALGSRGAWLLEPYTDKPDSTGIPTQDPANIKRTGEAAIRHGYQLCVHAIGDRANREVLNVYEQIFKEHPDRKNLRWRIEHAQHLNAADIPRFGKLGVIAAMQACHCTSDAPYVALRLGDKRAEEGAYVWQKLMKSGAIVGQGTDAPVESVNPIANFYAAVTRKTKDGKVFYPDQRLSREEALKSYTWNNAYAAFEEKLKGSLETGKLADITVLSKDIMTIPEDQILTTDVLYTIVGGKIMYESK
jgi:predicted amidohydrolase YtcJ